MNSNQVVFALLRGGENVEAPNSSFLAHDYAAQVLPSFEEGPMRPY